MTDDELTVLLELGIIAVLYIGYLVNQWKIKDLEDRVEKLEGKDA